MAQITKFQLKELKREAWFQVTRIENELKLLPPERRHRLVGMEKSKRRLLLLLFFLNRLEQDGKLELTEDDRGGVGYGYDDGTGANLAEPATHKGTAIER